VSKNNWDPILKVKKKILLLIVKKEITISYVTEAWRRGRF
jgi:hypothetical protein